MRAAPQGQGPPCCQSDRQVECCPAAPLVAFPNTSLSHDARSLACCFCHLVVSMAVHVESLSPALFSQDKLNFTSSSLIKPFVSKVVTRPLGELNSTPPSLRPPSLMRKQLTPVRVSIFPSSPARQDRDGWPGEFARCVSDCWWWFGRLRFEPSLKKHMGPDSPTLQMWDFLMLRDLTDEIWCSEPLFIYRQNNK